MIFQSSFLIANDNTLIALQFVESITFPTGEDLTVAKLKDDYEMDIVMCSGREYRISTRAQFDDDNWIIDRTGYEVARFAIVDKWKHILTGKP